MDFEDVSMSDLGVRAISETEMRSILDARRTARAAYDVHVANKHIWLGLDSAYEAKRAVLLGDFVEASNAINEVGT